jgi:hypothetical protein
MMDGFKALGVLAAKGVVCGWVISTPKPTVCQSINTALKAKYGNGLMDGFITIP